MKTYKGFMSKKTILFSLIVSITLLALGLRVYAAIRLNVDYDEPVYLGDALEYTNALRKGNFKMVAWIDHTYEHPSLYKLLYGIVLLTQAPLEKFHISDLPRLNPIDTTEAKQWNMAARYVSVALGSISVFFMACMNPLAGFFLAVSTLGVKYTSEVYLEALPLLTSLLCAATYMQWIDRIKKEDAIFGKKTLWLVLSGVFLGATAAGKYVYCIVGIAIVAHFVLSLLQKQINRKAVILILGWGILSLCMFVIFNPYLWPHPISRFVKSIVFHIDFQDSNLVRLYNYPWWQTFRWLTSFSENYNLGPASAFLINIDTLIFCLVLVGLPRLFQKNRFIFFWLVIGLSFLLVWTTKWPQYTMMILVPFTWAASDGVKTIWDFVVKRIKGLRARTA